ncbi:hypothetical protein [Streptomyces sp. 142MFCol3.1]|uniref:hypothetical protein n=1 Tax=Streptomyces sp. 142MFCol3.1 TaxID=1172179 RepID=UPI000419EEF2|nr:hypothetical protein [Streptomyces sp. 142MFCol3.1]
MVDNRYTERDRSEAPVPRDLPDQQVLDGEDPLDLPPEDDEDESASDGAAVPDTDEAGTGRKGAPQKAAVHPEHPVPDEPVD